MNLRLCEWGKIHKPSFNFFWDKNLFSRDMSSEQNKVAIDDGDFYRDVAEARENGS